MCRGDSLSAATFCWAVRSASRTAVQTVWSTSLPTEGVLVGLSGVGVGVGVDDAAGLDEVPELSGWTAAAFFGCTVTEQAVRKAAVTVATAASRAAEFRSMRREAIDDAQLSVRYLPTMPPIMWSVTWQW